MQVQFNNQNITFRKFQWGFSKELHKNQENIFSWKKPSVLLSKMPCRLFVKMTIFQDGSKVLVSGGNIIQINFIASIFRTLRSVDRITGRPEFKTSSSYISKWYPIRLRIEFGRRFLTIHLTIRISYVITHRMSICLLDWVSVFARVS